MPTRFSCQTKVSYIGPRMEAIVQVATRRSRGRTSGNARLCGLFRFYLLIPSYEASLNPLHILVFRFELRRDLFDDAETGY
jgi:hypothetical protein